MTSQFQSYPRGRRRSHRPKNDLMKLHHMYTQDYDSILSSNTFNCTVCSFSVDFPIENHEISRMAKKNLILFVHMLSLNDFQIIIKRDRISLTLLNHRLLRPNRMNSNLFFLFSANLAGSGIAENFITIILIIYFLAFACLVTLQQFQSTQQLRFHFVHNICTNTTSEISFS